MDWLPCCTHVKSTLPHDVWVVLNVCIVKIIDINKIKRAPIGANIKKKCYQSKTYRVIYICFTECILQCIFCAFFRFSSKSIQLLLCLSWKKVEFKTHKSLPYTFTCSKCCPLVLLLAKNLVSAFLDGSKCIYLPQFYDLPPMESGPNVLNWNLQKNIEEFYSLQ